MVVALLFSRETNNNMGKHFLTVSKEFFLVHQIRGVMFKERGEFDRAIEDFNKAISLNPFDIDLHHYRAEVFSVTGQLDKAIEDFTIAIGSKKNYYEDYYGRGLTFSKKGETGKAIRDFEKVVSLNPRDYEVYVSKSCFIEKGMKGRAHFPLCCFHLQVNNFGKL